MNVTNVPIGASFRVSDPRSDDAGKVFKRTGEDTIEVIESSDPNETWERDMNKWEPVELVS